MSRLKIFFHDNCFDGAASAAVFGDFYRQRVDAGVEIVLQGVQHRQGDPFSGLPLDGDDNACVDFRYCDDDRMTWWFDHHVSAFQPPEKRDHFDADDSGQKFYDPAAASCTKFEAEVLRDRFGYELPEAFQELVTWADIIDGAKFDSPATIVELASPALELMTWIENNRDHALTERFIFELGTRPLAEVAAEPWIRDPLEPLLAQHRRNIELLRREARLDDGVVHYELLEHAVTPNKFIAYYLYPTARYTVGLTRLDSRLKISVGYNPWSGRERGHDIASICERFGGGGHPVVGAVSLPADQAGRATEIAAEIRSELAG